MRLLAFACEHRDQLNMAHGLCSTCYHATYYQTHKSQWPEYDSSWRTQLQRRLQRMHISTSRYLMMLWRQQGRCPCGQELEKSRIDHDHACCPNKRRSCGKCVRGLLCNRCNLLLGMVESEPHLIPAYLVTYLKETDLRKSEAL